MPQMPRDDKLKDQQKTEAPKAKRQPRPQKSQTSKVAKAKTAVPQERNVFPLPRLQEMYRTQVVPTLMEEFGYGNIMQVPRLQKIVLNVGVGEALTNAKALEGAANDLATIAGQKPVVTRAKKSIAGFKLREGSAIGVSATVRGRWMYYLLDRLCNAGLPRIRDFRGLSRSSFDGRGNYSIGIREQVIFPEIEYGSIDRIRGLQMTVCTTATTDREAMRLLELLGMPFSRQ